MPTPTSSVGFTGRGGSLNISTDGTNFTKVGQVQKVANSGDKVNFADITNFDSPNAFIERIPTTSDSGTLTFTIVVNPTDAGLTMLLAAKEAQTLLSCKLQYPPVGTQTAGMQKTFSAYVSSAPMPNAGITDASTMDCELTITGAVTTVAGTTGS